MFTNCNKCAINDLYELPYNIFIEIQNPDQLVIGMAMTEKEDTLYQRNFSKELAELTKFKYQKNIISSIKLYDSESNSIKTFRKYKNVINVAHNKYRGKEKNYDIIITFGR